MTTWDKSLSGGEQSFAIECIKTSHAASLRTKRRRKGCLTVGSAIHEINNEVSESVAQQGRRRISVLELLFKDLNSSHN